MADLNSTTAAVTTTPTTTTLEDSNTTTTLSWSTTQTSTEFEISTEFINSTNTTSTTTSGTSPVDEAPSYGAVIGGVIGGVVALVICAVVVIIILRRKRQSKKKLAKQTNLPVPPSVVDLQKTETNNSKQKKRWSEKSKPDAVSDNTGSPSESHYVNEVPLYIKPEPPTREIYSGPDKIEYYMGTDTTNTNQEPTEVYSDPNTPDLRKTQNCPNEEAPKPPNTSSVLETNKEQGPLRDYENVPKKRTEPPKADSKKTGEIEADEEQTVYENETFGSGGNNGSNQ